MCEVTEIVEVDGQKNFCLLYFSYFCGFMELARRGLSGKLP